MIFVVERVYDFDGEMSYSTTDCGSFFHSKSNKYFSEQHQDGIELDYGDVVVSGGHVLWSGLVSGGSKDVAGARSETGLTINVTEGMPITLAARSISGNVPVSAVFRWEEEW